MGGKSPFIVLDDADLDDDLIEHAATSAFWNGGQNCSANMRQLVDARIADSYLEKVVDRAKAYKVGDPLDPDTDIGAMVTEEHMERVTGYIDKGASEGANQLTGGAREGRGYFVEPTVFSGLTPDMTIAREEIFGPVLGVLPVKDMDDALHIASDSEYGLHATVFTRDIDRAHGAPPSVRDGLGERFLGRGYQDAFWWLQAIGFAVAGQWHRGNATVSPDQDDLDFTGKCCVNTIAVHEPGRCMLRGSTETCWTGQGHPARNTRNKGLIPDRDAIIQTRGQCPPRTVRARCHE